MKTSTAHLRIPCALLLLSTAVAGAADHPTVRAAIQAPKDRQLAPAFRLLDASGKAVHLSGYRGKIVLLDFWATECGGCKVEIPWFMQFQRTYRNNGLAVAGVSMDILYEKLKGPEEGWGRVTPFVHEHKVNYPILMGDNRVTKSYNIDALPVSYLIDRHGRVAAAYVGLVDKNNMAENIKALLVER